MATASIVERALPLLPTSALCPPAFSQIIEEGAVTTASFVERVLPVALPKGTMEAGSGQIVQKGLHKVGVWARRDARQAQQARQEQQG
mgnify:CR=1 FL=1